MAADFCLFPVLNAELTGLDAHEAFVIAARNLYTPNVVWAAPNRGIEWRGRELVIRQLLREAGGMHDPEFTLIRRSQNDEQVIHEYAVRFVYTGDGIEHSPLAPGDFAELKRVRVLTLVDGRCTRETCIESWSVLLPSDAPR